MLEDFWFFYRNFFLFRLERRDVRGGRRKREKDYIRFIVYSRRSSEEEGKSMEVGGKLK